MAKVISIRLSDEEKRILDEASAAYGSSLSSMVKNLVFEKLEDEYDLQVIREYEKSKADKTLKTRPIAEFWKELGI